MAGKGRWHNKTNSCEETRNPTKGRAICQLDTCATYAANMNLKAKHENRDCGGVAVTLIPSLVPVLASLGTHCLCRHFRFRRVAAPLRPGAVHPHKPDAEHPRHHAVSLAESHDRPMTDVQESGGLRPNTQTRASTTRPTKHRGRGSGGEGGGGERRKRPPPRAPPRRKRTKIETR
jgi:hypothetical protein